MALSLVATVVVLSLLSLSHSLPSQTILDAAEILSDSGYVSMALTLELVSQTLVPNLPSATLFAASNAAFTESGQPPLSLLQFHSLPLALSYESLRSLPFRAKIPTMFVNHSLIVTTAASDSHVSFNNVNITSAPLFDDGSLIIFGVDKFFDPNFQALDSTPSPSRNIGCTGDANASSAGGSFAESGGVLRSKGYSVMASFLDLQLLGFRDGLHITVLAPIDEVMMDLVANFSIISASIFHRHVIPCKLSWSDLVHFDNGSMLRTSLEDFTINITRSGDTLKLNGVAVTSPDMYSSDWLVIHGLGEVLTIPEAPQQAADSPSETGGSNTSDQTALYNFEF